MYAYFEYVAKISLILYVDIWDDLRKGRNIERVRYVQQRIYT